MSDIHYPEILRSYRDAPQTIEFKGNKDLFNSRCIAIIGTRHPSEFGIRTAYCIARFFAEEGFTIVSGLADGIDTAAHRGALSVIGGKTIAILGLPFSNIYPKENRPLAQRILDNDGLVYYAPGTNFVSRDYLQAEQSLAVIPVQAGDHSGTRHATKHALSHNKLVFIPEPQAKDQEKYPEKYVGIYEYIERGKNNPKCQTIAGKQDYPALLALLG